MAKYMAIGRARNSDPASIQAAMEMFQKIGPPTGTTHAWAGLDGKTSFIVIDTDDYHEVLKAAASASPFTEIDLIPVVDFDEAAWAAVASGNEAWSTSEDI